MALHFDLFASCVGFLEKFSDEFNAFLSIKKWFIEIVSKNDMKIEFYFHNNDSNHNH